MDSTERFTTLIGALAETFGVAVTRGRLLGYWYALRDLDPDALERACTMAMRACERMPVPSEIRDLADGGNASQHAIVAWAIVCRTIPTIGSYRSVNFEDPAINAAIKWMGGWPALLDRTGDDFEIWARKDFICAYTVARRRQSLGQWGAPLAGIGDSPECMTPVAIPCETGSRLQRLEPRPALRHGGEPQRLGDILRGQL